MNQRRSKIVTQVQSCLRLTASAKPPGISEEYEKSNESLFGNKI